MKPGITMMVLLLALATTFDLYHPHGLLPKQQIADTLNTWTNRIRDAYNTAPARFGGFRRKTTVRRCICSGAVRSVRSLDQSLACSINPHVAFPLMSGNACDCVRDDAGRRARRGFKELIQLATKAESEAVRVAAIKEMFDRGFGKAAQPIEGNMSYGVSQQLSELFQENAGNSLGAEIARRALPSIEWPEVPLHGTLSHWLRFPLPCG